MNLEFCHFFSPGVQSKPSLSMLEYGNAAVSTRSGVTFVGDSAAGDPRTTSRGHRVTSCTSPVFSATVPTPALLGPAG